MDLVKKKKKHEVSDGTFQISDATFQGNVILDIDSLHRLWTRFGPTRLRAPQTQTVFLLISMEWSEEKGSSGSWVPLNTICFTSCLHILDLHGWPLTLQLNLSHFNCLSADMIYPVLLFSEASLWHWQIIVVAEECFHWPPMWTCTVLLASLLALASCCCCFMKLLSSKVRINRYQIRKPWSEF